jgi:hypothetical protein
VSRATLHVLAEGHSLREDRALLLEGVLRLAVKPRLQKLVEVRQAADALPDEEKAIVNRLFFPTQHDNLSGEGIENGRGRERALRALHLLAQSLAKGTQGAPSEEEE